MRRRLTVHQSARDRNLVQLATVRDELRIRGTGARTSALERYIRAASDYIASDKGLRYPPWRQKVQEQFAGTGRTIFRPTWHPVETLVSVTRNGASVDGALIVGTYRDQIYLEDGWEDNRYLDGPIVRQPVRDGDLPYTAVMYTGWLMPGEATTWAAATAYVLGDVVRRSDWSEGALYLECTTQGTSGGSQPTLPAEGATVADGPVTWTARACQEVPAAIQQDALDLTLYYCQKAGVF